MDQNTWVLRAADWRLSSAQSPKAFAVLDASAIEESRCNCRRTKQDETADQHGQAALHVNLPDSSANCGPQRYDGSTLASVPVKMPSIHGSRAEDP
jgi:hypothetical protein